MHFVVDFVHGGVCKDFLSPFILGILANISLVDGSENFSAEVISRICSCKSSIVTALTHTEFMYDVDWDQVMISGSTEP